MDHDDGDGSGAEAVHLAIPGEEGFAYVAPSAEGAPEEGDPTSYGGEEDEESMTLAMNGTWAGVQEAEIFETKAAPGHEEGGGAGASTASSGAVSQRRSCAWDPLEFCATYAGCAPLFGG